MENEEKGEVMSPCRLVRFSWHVTCAIPFGGYKNGYVVVSKIILQKKWKPKSNVPPHLSQDIYKMWKIIMIQELEAS